MVAATGPSMSESVCTSGTCKGPTGQNCEAEFVLLCVLVSVWVCVFKSSAFVLEMHVVAFNWFLRGLGWGGYNSCQQRWLRICVSLTQFRRVVWAVIVVGWAAVYGCYKFKYSYANQTWAYSPSVILRCFIYQPVQLFLNSRTWQGAWMTNPFFLSAFES